MTERGPSPRARLLGPLSWVLVALPWLLYALLLPRFGELPRNDYWVNFQEVVTGDRLTADPLAWLHARSNEHRITLPLAFWAANIVLTGGDNRVQSALSLAMLLATFAILYRLLPASLRARPAWRAGTGFLISALVFTPVAAHNWVLGFSGNQWFGANLSAVAAIALLARRRPDERLLAVLPAIAAGAVGSFVHGSHLGLWPALLCGALLLPLPRGTLPLLGAAAGGAVAFFLWGYEVPPHHPLPGGRAGGLWSFCRVYLGQLVSPDAGVNRLVGTVAVGLGVLALAVVVARRGERRRVLAPWLMLALFAAANCVGTALGRQGFGEEMAFSSRYASLPALYWLGTLMTLVLALHDAPAARHRRAGLAALGLAAVALLVPMFVSGIDGLRWQLHRVRFQPLARLAILWQVRDPATIALVTFPRAPAALEPFWRRMRHVPFDDAERWALDRPWSGAPPPSAASPPAGGFERRRPQDGRFDRVDGRIAWTEKQPVRIVFLDDANRVRGYGVFVPSRRRGRASLLPQPPPLHWRGYVRRGDAPLRPYLEIRGDPTLHPLATAPRVRRG